MTKSLEKKLNEITQLCFNIAYKNTDNGYYHDTRDIDLGEWDDIIWSFVDGLYSKLFFDRMDNRCSLQATIDFDIGKEESKIDNWIEGLKKFYNNINPIYEIKEYSLMNQNRKNRY